MPTLIQINVTSNWGSTGKIAEQIGLCAQAHGWESYIAYGRMMNPSKNKLVKVGAMFDVYEHYAENLILDNEGLASRRATHKLVKKIVELRPDIVHLHNIHDHWLNYEILFKYLNQTNIKVVWTIHDFWAITGHCMHFVQIECDRFMTECNDCPCTKGRLFPFIKQVRRNFLLKKKLFTSNKHMIIVPVSEWVSKNIRLSYLKDKEIYVIPNGIDVSVFKPTTIESIEQKEIKERIEGLANKFVIMAVSSQWTCGGKGLNDYRAMSKLLGKDEVILLVGVPDKISKDFPENIVGIQRTNNQYELAAIYSRADVVCSFSAAETFGLTIIEGYACGTPAIVYDNTALPSLITPETGYVVPNKDYKAAYDMIKKIRANGKASYSDACITLVYEKYNKDKCYENYIALYESLIRE